MDSEQHVTLGDTREFPCGQCGATLTFAPGTNHLTCPYCGHQEVIQAEQKPIVEHDLSAGLARVRHARFSELSQSGREIRCDGCGANSVVTTQSDHCAFCGSPRITPLTRSETTIVPESLLPFHIDERGASSAFRQWVASRWFVPNDFRRRAKHQGMDGVYLPFWTFDSQTDTRYVGQRGDHYYETEYYEDAEGNRKSRQVRRTRWRSAAGSVHVNFDDVLVCATSTLPPLLVTSLEPWDLKLLQPYQPSYLSGFTTERYTVELSDGFDIAESRMEPSIRNAIRRDIGGDVQQIFSTHIVHSETTFKHVLLPLWISSFRYNDHVYRVIVNARTGEVAGERPWSALKITLVVLLGLLIVGLIVLAVRFS